MTRCFTATLPSSNALFVCRSTNELTAPSCVKTTLTQSSGIVAALSRSAGEKPARAATCAPLTSLPKSVPGRLTGSAGRLCRGRG